MFQGGAAPVAPVTLAVLVLDMNDKRVFEQTTTLPVTAFADGRAASHALDLPLEKMQHGPHLLSITATLPSARARAICSAFAELAARGGALAGFPP